MKKSLLSTLIILCMILTLLPGAALAANVTSAVALSGELGGASVSGNTVTLTSDVALSDTISITGGDITLDLNGNTITGANGGDGSTSYEGSAWSAASGGYVKQTPKTVKIAGNTLSSTTPYYDNASNTSATEPSNWNAYFDAANSTLHLKSLVVSTSEHKVIEVAGVTTLYIELEGTNTVTSENDDPISSGIDAGTTNLVINGSGSLTVDAKAGGTGIKANSIKLQYPATLTVKGAEKATDKVVSCITSVYDAKGGADVTTAPTGDYSHNDTSTATRYNHIVFSLKPAPGFPVYVNNMQVMSANMDDVLGDGKVKYTPAHGSTPAKLTLNGASITLSYRRGSYTAGIYAESEPLEIHLIGINTIDTLVSSGNTCGVYSEKALTITAEAGATLTASASIPGGNGTTYAIYSGESIALDHCEITAPTGATLSSDKKIIDDNDDNLRCSTATIKGPYTITYDLDGGSVAGTNPAEYFASDAEFTLTNPTKQDHTFAGWTGTDLTAATTGVTIPTGSTGDRSYTATWTPNAPVYYPSFYTLTFVTNGGGDISAVTLIEYSSVDLAKYVPTREGYTFTGWYADEALNEKLTDVKLTKNAAVYAGWEWVNPFSDVTASDWFYADAEYVAAKGLFKGETETEFAPEKPMTRAMLATVLYRLEGEPTVMFVRAPDKVFSDVPDGAWYEKAVQWAQLSGIVEGSDGKFMPEAEISREQLATMLYRYEQYKGGGFTGSWMFPLGFKDAGDVSDWAYEALCWMTMNKLMQGDGDDLMPQAPATRAQVAAMLHRFTSIEK